MGFSFEEELRKAERTINNLIVAINREGGNVYICEQDESGLSAKLTRPISITYWVPIESRSNED